MNQSVRGVLAYIFGIIGAAFFASHLLVTKFLGVGGIFCIREFRIP